MSTTGSLTCSCITTSTRTGRNRAARLRYSMSKGLGGPVENDPMIPVFGLVSNETVDVVRFHPLDELVACDSLKSTGRNGGCQPRNKFSY